MAKTLNKLRLKILYYRRNRLTEKIKFNNTYCDIATGQMAEKLESLKFKREQKMKRRLLPLEKKASSEKTLAEYEYEKALKGLEEKQKLPKLAIEQTYKRQSGKNEHADVKRKQGLKKLDEKKQALKDKYQTMIDNGSEKIDQESLETYNRALEADKVHLDAYSKEKTAKFQEKSKRLQDKKKQENAGLQSKLELVNKSLSLLDDETRNAMTETDTVLEVTNLEMQFGGVKAVDKLSFNVKAGEIFGLIGPNGAGKTTVFNCITQFNKPKGGSIYYRTTSGEVVNMNKRKVHSVVKLGIARTFQNVELIWELSVLDNMLIGAHSLYHANFFDHLIHSRKLKRDEQVMRVKALDVLERLGLLQYKDVIPLGLPYGVLKKLELARTLMINPRLIILDEPAAGLNETETEELSEIIKKISLDFGCTIFLVEHDMGLVMDICDTICAISFGKRLAIGSPEDIQNNETVQEAYLGGTMMEED